MGARGLEDHAGGWGIGWRLGDGSGGSAKWQWRSRIERTTVLHKRTVQYMELQTINTELWQFTIRVLTHVEAPEPQELNWLNMQFRHSFSKTYFSLDTILDQFRELQNPLLGLSQNGAGRVWMVHCECQAWLSGTVWLKFPFMVIVTTICRSSSGGCGSSPN